MSALRKLRRGAHAPPGTRLFHYTICDYLPEICKSGEILLATLHLPLGEQPAAWFSFASDWEGTAMKGIVMGGQYRQLGRAGLTQLCGVARIEIDPNAAPHTWEAHRQLSGITGAKARELERVAREWRALPQNWRVSYEPVRSQHWRAIEVDFGSGWRPAEARSA